MAPGRLSFSSDSLSDQEEEEWSLSFVARCLLDDEEEKISMHSTSTLSLPDELWLSSTDSFPADDDIMLSSAMMETCKSIHVGWLCCVGINKKIILRQYQK